MVTFAQLEARILAVPAASYGAGVTEESIAEVENALEVRIVGGYRLFLRRFGWLKSPSLELNGLGHGVPHHLELLRVTLSERHEMGPPLPRFLLPLWNDGLGNNYCLDTSSVAAGESPIAFWDHELDEDQEIDQVASSFQEWLTQAMR